MVCEVTNFNVSIQSDVFRDPMFFKFIRDHAMQINRKVEAPFIELLFVNIAHNFSPVGSAE